VMKKKKQKEYVIKESCETCKHNNGVKLVFGRLFRNCKCGLTSISTLCCSNYRRKK